MAEIRKVLVIKGNGTPLISAKALPNNPCLCGSGLKQKKCCGAKTKYYHSKENTK